MAAYTDQNLRHAFLVQLNFLSGTYYVWNGFRNLTVGGITYLPVGPRATVESIEDPVSDRIAPVILKVTGVDAVLLSKALAETYEIKNQMASVLEIFLDSNWQPIGTPATFAVVRMDTIKISKTRETDGSWTCSIAISCENYLTNGPCPPYGRYSNTDQWERNGSNADLYFSYMQILQNQRMRWPSF